MPSARAVTSFLVRPTRRCRWRSGTVRRLEMVTPNASFAVWYGDTIGNGRVESVSVSQPAVGTAPGAVLGR